MNDAVVVHRILSGREIVFFTQSKISSFFQTKLFFNNRKEPPLSLSASPHYVLTNIEKCLADNSTPNLQTNDKIVIKIRVENVELILIWKMLFGWKIFDGKLFVNIFGLLYLCSFMFFWYLAESLACYAALACGMLSVELRSISVFVCF